MQLINRTSHTHNFTVLPNAISHNTGLSAHARLALIYLLAKPPAWKLRITDLKRAIGCGINKAYRCLHELIEAGYARMVRGQQKVEWFFFDTPQTRAESQSDGFQRYGKSDVLVKTDSIIKKETNNVVVEIVSEAQKPSLADDVPVIPGLKQSQQKAASKILSGLDQTTITAILLVFNSAMQAGRVANPVGYLHRLVQSARDGSLTVPNTNAPFEPLEQRLKRQRAEQRNKSPKVDNNSHFNNLIATYGAKVARFIAI